MYKAVDSQLMVVQDKEYKKYFEATNTGVIYLDREKRIKNVNSEVQRIFALHREGLIGQKAEVVFCNFGKNFLKIFSLGDEEEVYSTTSKVKINGQYVYLHINILKIIDSLGLVTGNIIILQDVSAVHATLKQIQTTKMLMSLGELAAGVAHHVRTPLTTISGYLQLMLNRVENDKYTVKREVLEGLLGEVSYINDVVKELIMFAKPAIVKKPGVDINKILNEALLLTFNNIGQDGIHINRQIVKGLPSLMGDSNLLQQALVNILQNALEAMGENGVLTVKTWRDYEINMIVISITDSGAGIAPEILPRVFEPFYTSKIDRMGLGLPIAYRIITEHGGFINLSLSAEGATGTKVNIYLPLFEDELERLSIMQQQILNLQ
ncbi:two-component system sensor histidine kinase NtrB [Anaerosinus massiliensis]|uniref:two-component system sensor histidine kinase NtrB n=1 Tax=Massilibacillus massiliensis TaxID=1806837 RepID=UPI000B076832|nr:ATP-binding protein [Massilibacillus massiliensis]